jgi:hypothetical protein
MLVDERPAGMQLVTRADDREDHPSPARPAEADDRPPPALAHLEGLEGSVRHLGSDSFGLARVIIRCTEAIVVALHRIERKLDR